MIRPVRWALAEKRQWDPFLPEFGIRSWQVPHALKPSGTNNIRREFPGVPASADDVGISWQDRQVIFDAASRRIPAGERVARTLPGGATESWQFNSLGQLTQHTDFNGQRETSSYDAFGRLAGKQWFAVGSSAPGDMPAPGEPIDRFRTPNVRPEQLFESLRLLRDAGITLLLVEQNVHMALAISDYGYVLTQGRTELEGPARQLIKNEHVRSAYLGL